MFTRGCWLKNFDDALNAQTNVEKAFPLKSRMELIKDDKNGEFNSVQIRLTGKEQKTLQSIFNYWKQIQYRNEYRDKFFNEVKPDNVVWSPTLFTRTSERSPDKITLLDHARGNNLESNQEKDDAYSRVFTA